MFILRLYVKPYLWLRIKTKSADCHKVVIG